MFADECRSDDALAICGGCVVRRQCRAWALATAVEGVAGGMTEAERRAWRTEAGQPEPVVTVEDFLGADVVSGDRTWGRGRSDAILDAVARWTDNVSPDDRSRFASASPVVPSTASAPDAATAS